MFDFRHHFRWTSGENAAADLVFASCLRFLSPLATLFFFYFLPGCPVRGVGVRSKLFLIPANGCEMTQHLVPGPGVTG